MTRTAPVGVNWRAWFICEGCQQPKSLEGSKVRGDIRRCAECMSANPVSDREYQLQLVTARVVREQQEHADAIAAAYRRGFEDGWRESKLEESPEITPRNYTCATQ